MVRIAIIGNMNNNGFALMRYLRDLGFDAHLFMFQNDGVGPVSHFHPTCDTWDYNKWRPFVHQLSAADNIISGLNWAMGLVLLGALKIRIWLFRRNVAYRPVRIAQLKKKLAGFDFFIGSGIAPALFDRCGMKLDVFYQYANGIEFLGAPEFQLRLSDASSVERALLKIVSDRQRQGIVAAKRVINSGFGQTKRSLDQIDKSFDPLFVPMVYYEEPTSPDAYSDYLSKILTLVNTRSPACILLSPTRQLWVNKRGFSEPEWLEVTKNSDWLFRAFAAVKGERPDERLLLLVADYGDDVVESKKLCDELGIASDVVWLQTLSRKELLVLMNHVDAVVGEFMNVDEMLWGGVGWEALLAGKPLIHGFRYASGCYEEYYGHPPPPVMAVWSLADVTRHIRTIVDQPDVKNIIGREAREWFSRHQGHALARQWIEPLIKNRCHDSGVQNG